jgi:hypothetical protein
MLRNALLLLLFLTGTSLVPLGGAQDPSSESPSPLAEQPLAPPPPATCPAADDATVLHALRNASAAPGDASLQQQQCAMEVTFGVLLQREPGGCALIRITNNLAATVFGWQLVYSSPSGLISPRTASGAVLISAGNGERISPAACHSTAFCAPCTMRSGPSSRAALIRATHAAG